MFNEEEAQEVVKEEAPKLILKPLPTELKYAYLKENDKNFYERGQNNHRYGHECGRVGGSFNSSNNKGTS